MCLVINFNKLSILFHKNDALPKIPIENDVEPDISKEPFYCYPLEKNYSGRDPLSESSREFYVKMAKTCNVDPKLSTDEIINKIKMKIPYLYANRNKQQLKLLKNGGKNNKKTRKNIR